MEASGRRIIHFSCGGLPRIMSKTEKSASQKEIDDPKCSSEPNSQYIYYVLCFGKWTVQCTAEIILEHSSEAVVERRHDM
jgi:hypothetical protein